MCKYGNNLVPWGGDGGGAPVALGTDLDASVRTKFISFPLTLFNSSSPPPTHTHTHRANPNEYKSPADCGRTHRASDDCLEARSYVGKHLCFKGQLGQHK